MTVPSLLVFICAHNVCRSAIAEAIAADAVARRGLAVQVASAGTHALPDYGAASVAESTMNEVGLSLAQHRSQPVTADLMSRATLVVTMTVVQRELLQAAWPDYQDKVLSFDDLTQRGDVLDPVGGDAEEVRALRDTLQSSMPAILAALEERAEATA